MSVHPEEPLSSNRDSKLPNAGRRRARRRTIDSVVSLQLVPGAVRGTSRDVSDGGMLLFSSERLPVTATFEEDGREVVLRGYLVRVQRTSQEHVAYAIEFDEPYPEPSADEDRSTPGDAPPPGDG